MGSEMCIRDSYTNTSVAAQLDRLFFSERVANIWNRLPVDIVDFSTLCNFRDSLDVSNGCSVAC